MKTAAKLTRRAVRAFPGRYLALLLIVLLSVGFFSGLKITRTAMADTADNYLSEQNFYDYRLMSTLGFTDSDVEEFAALDFVSSAEGVKSLDAIAAHGGVSAPYHFMSLPGSVSTPSLTAGRLPQSAGECLADDERFTESDIGTAIIVESADGLTRTEYTIVGLANSPMYLGTDRGTTDIGSGSLAGFIYLLPECFTSEAYTEVQLTLRETAAAWSDEYDALISQYEDEVSALCTRLANEHYSSLLSQNGLTADTAAAAGLSEPQTYVLTRDENAGYVSFESDTSIISGIANIFPFFFILIAMLVCITTMTRMVDEERTQIGVLKALGYSAAAVSAKYLLYALSAAVIGWAAGFFLGTWALPRVFWYAYSSIYDFAPIAYVFSPTLAAATLLAALAFILGATLISCRRELAGVPAGLLRPRAARKGKRIFLERITPLWRRLTFLQKVTLRNMFRYKKRLVMMLVGISCCTALLVTGFGVRDSMIDTGSLQYENVQTYGMEAGFTGEGSEIRDRLAGLDGVAGVTLAAVHSVDVDAADAPGSVSLYVFEDAEGMDGYWQLGSGGEGVAFPGAGQAVVSNAMAERLGLGVDDSLTLRNTDGSTLTVTISGVFDNYLGNYVIVSAATYGEWAPNTALLKTGGDEEALARTLTGLEGIDGVTRLSTTRDSVNSALSCLNYIIWLIVGFSGALAFIVIFNLTNINLAERSREVATVEVLGFRPGETNSYILRENVVLSVAAGLLGLPLGVVFHRMVMGMIVIDSIAFDVRISPLSFVLAFVFTVCFALVVNIFMRRRVAKIKMAESLKAVE